MSMDERLLRVIIFIMAMTRNSPTPTPTVAMRRVEFITASTCPARTERSGSAIVISTPMTKHTESSTMSFLDFVRPEPTCSPIGVIARSAPRLKSPIPRMRNTADMPKTALSIPLSGARGVNERMSTMTVIGKTDMKDSRNFRKTLFI